MMSLVSMATDQRGSRPNQQDAVSEHKDTHCTETHTHHIPNNNMMLDLLAYDLYI